MRRSGGRDGMVDETAAHLLYLYYREMDSYQYALQVPEPYVGVQSWDLPSLTTTVTSNLDTSNISAFNVGGNVANFNDGLITNVTACNVTTSNLNTNTIYIQSGCLSNVAPSNLVGYVDQSWVTTDPTNAYRELGKAAGSATAGGLAFAEAALILGDPLTSPSGISAFDAAESVMATTGALAYDLALETCVSLGQYIGSAQAAHLGGLAGGEAAVLGATSDAMATAIGVAAGTTSESVDATTPVVGWVTKLTPVVVSLGTIVGNIAGTLALTQKNVTSITDLTATVSDHTDLLATHTDEIATLTTDVAGIDGAVTTLTTDLTAVTADVATLTAASAAQDIELATHASEISTLQSDQAATSAQATYASNAIPSYLPLAGGTLNGHLVAYSNIAMVNPLLLRATGAAEGQLQLSSNSLRFVSVSGGSNTTQFSVTSNGLFPLSTPYTKILGNTESGGQFGRIECSSVTGFSAGVGLTPPSVSPYAVNWLNVSSNSEISTFANDLGYMQRIVNSNAEVGCGGFTLCKDGSVVDANRYTVFDTSGSLRRQGGSVGGSTGVTISPSGYLTVGALTIDPTGNISVGGKTIVDSKGRWYGFSEEKASSYKAASASRPSGATVFGR